MIIQHNTTHRTRTTAVLVIVLLITAIFLSSFGESVMAATGAQQIAQDLVDHGDRYGSEEYVIFNNVRVDDADYSYGVVYSPSTNELGFMLKADADAGMLNYCLLKYDLEANSWEDGFYLSSEMDSKSAYFGAIAPVSDDYKLGDILEYQILNQSDNVSRVDMKPLFDAAVNASMASWNDILLERFGYGMEVVFPNFNGTGSSSSQGNQSTTTPTPAASQLPEFNPANNEPGVSGFVERLYAVAMGRASDPTGKQNWIDTITHGGSTGADAARGFLLSSEFANKGYSNEDFVEVLYRTFFNRTADESGRAAWVGVLNNGSSREEVINGFINSTEWANLCLTYGIASGGTGTPNVDIEPNQATIDFATRLYTTCLNRNADQNGLMAWARQLANQRDTGTGAARGFFFSTEFVNQNVDNAEYVTRLYRTFMGREPDQAGFDAWVGQLNAGVSREEVFDGFSQSQEFTAICAQYGIIRG